MSVIQRRWLRRSAVGLGAAMALFVATASPAAADGLPDDTSVELEVVDGFIDVDGTVFPLGGEPDPDDDCATGDPSTISATIGEEISNVASVTFDSADFDSTEVDEIFGNPVCATLVVTNTPAGTQTQTGTGTGTVVVDNPGSLIDVVFNVGCELEDIDVDLSGPISGTSSPWDLTLGASGFFVPAVQSGGDCSSFEAFVINAVLGGATSNTEAELVFEVTE